MKNTLLILLLVFYILFNCCKAQVNDNICNHKNKRFELCLNGADKYISRDQLPQLEKLTFCASLDSFKIDEYDLYVQQDSGFARFEIRQPEFPSEVRNIIRKLKENQFIVVDNVKIITPHDGRRTIEGASFQIKIK